MVGPPTPIVNYVLIARARDIRIYRLNEVNTLFNDFPRTIRSAEMPITLTEMRVVGLEGWSRMDFFTRNRNNPIARAELFPPDASKVSGRRSRCLDEKKPPFLLRPLFLRAKGNRFRGSRP